MKNRMKIKKRWVIWLMPLLLVVILAACHFKFKSDALALAELNKVLIVNAGEEVEFNLTIISNPNDRPGERLIFSVYAPKIWNPRQSVSVTFTCPKYWGNEVKTMTLIPENTSPKNQPGLTWDQALKNKTPIDPNVEGAEMQWVTFMSDDAQNVSGNSDPEVFVKVKVKTGPENLRCKFGFFCNISSDGLGGSADYYGWIFTDCFATINGEGEIIDYCELHYNAAVPGSATQNDILTFRFNGGIDSDPATANDLAQENEIYYNATAYTALGNQYTKKILMSKEGVYGRSFSITYWAESFFAINPNETITKIEYYFSNLDGSKFVDWYDDRHKSKDMPRALEPFVYIFNCK